MSNSYLLDTNHASPLVTLGHPLRTRVLDMSRNGTQFGITAPCLTEAIFGFCMLPRERANRSAWHLIARNLFMYSVGHPEAEAAADLQISLRRQGWQLGTIDALAAVVALRNNLTLLTTDRDFSQVPGMRCENWMGTPSD